MRSFLLPWTRDPIRSPLPDSDQHAEKDIKKVFTIMVDYYIFQCILLKEDFSVLNGSNNK